MKRRLTGPTRPRPAFDSSVVRTIAPSGARAQSLAADSSARQVTHTALISRRRRNSHRSSPTADLSAASTGRSTGASRRPACAGASAKQQRVHAPTTARIDCARRAKATASGDTHRARVQPLASVAARPNLGRPLCQNRPPTTLSPDRQPFVPPRTTTTTTAAAATPVRRTVSLNSDRHGAANCPDYALGVPTD
uniref:Uncharacterized protein n=1 Tax=Plectus sambesii TaxID=2011161 RepID=A0A914UZX5_9BILA